MRHAGKCCVQEKISVGDTSVNSASTSAHSCRILKGWGCLHYEIAYIFPALGWKDAPRIILKPRQYGIEPLKESNSLDSNAIKAVKKWKFHATVSRAPQCLDMHRSRALPKRFKLPYNLKLPEKEEKLQQLLGPQVDAFSEKVKQNPYGNCHFYPSFKMRHFSMLILNTNHYSAAMLRTPLRLCTFHNRVMPAGRKNLLRKEISSICH